MTSSPTTRGLFITGTDTGVGKTYVTAAIARDMRACGHRVGAYKPACSGAEVDAAGQTVWQDVQELAAATQFDDIDRIAPQRFAAPLAPPVAAAREGKSVDAHLLRTGAAWWSGRVDLLLVEGVGGLLCPLTERETVADFAADLGFPLVIVARLNLGTINHTLLTLDAAHKRGLPVAGLVLNEGLLPVDAVEAETNPAEIVKRVDVPLLAIVRRDGSAFTRDGKQVDIDWWSLAREETKLSG